MAISVDRLEQQRIAEDLAICPEMMEVGQVWVHPAETVYHILKISNGRKPKAFCLIIDCEHGVSYGDVDMENMSETMVCVLKKEVV